MKYNSEEEFLKNYNSDDFKKLSMTADTLILVLVMRNKIIIVNLVRSISVFY